MKKLEEASAVLLGTPVEGGARTDRLEAGGGFQGGSVLILDLSAGSVGTKSHNFMQSHQMVYTFMICSLFCRYVYTSLKILHSKTNRI